MVVTARANHSKEISKAINKERESNVITVKRILAIETKKTECICDIPAEGLRFERRQARRDMYEPVFQKKARKGQIFQFMF